MKAIYTIGVSASGKTTWAEQFCKETGAVNINRDSIRFDILKNEGVISDIAYLWKHWNFKREGEVNKVVATLIEESAELKRNIVFSDTNLNLNRLIEHSKNIESMGYIIAYKYFPIEDIDVAIKRDKNRVPSVGESVIRKQWIQWLEHGELVTGIREYRPIQSNPKAIVCDIDGTVCRMKNRSPYEWNKVGNDTPRNEILSILKAMSKDHVIIFLSGRDGICEPETREWLDKYYGKDYHLFMRKKDDSRKDRVIKNELFFGHVAENFNVVFAIDDRKQMIQYWQDIKIPLLNVGNSYEDF